MSCLIPGGLLRGAQSTVSLDTQLGGGKWYEDLEESSHEVGPEVGPLKWVRCHPGIEQKCV